MLRFGAPVLALLMLAGCTKTVAEMNYSERKALAQEINQRCYAQGIRPGSPEFKPCAQVEVQREIATRERRARIEDAHASRPRGPNFCQRFGNTVQCF